jgi:pantoate--beta-alanine ligase
LQLLDRIDQVRKGLEEVRCAGRTVGLVPTMGALHAGHRSLIGRAAAECDVTLVTVFVNPLQFGPHEDLARYPRDLDRDAALAAGAGADLLFAPPVAEMYPEPPAVRVTVDGALGDRLEGATRPGHFSGVATIVAKLFAIAGPCRAYFGEKDWQQLAVVRRMAVDLSFPVEIVGCPTVREDDGLALSSRNRYLSPGERRAAPALSAGLRQAAADIRAGHGLADALDAARAAIVVAGFAIDYVEARHAETLELAEPEAAPLRLLAAARLGTTRLIDNLAV